MAPLTLEVPENANMAAIHTVEACDADVGDNGRVTYSITGGNVDGRFYINADTGQLSCSPLDREQTPTYNLSITATDSAPSSPAPSDSAPSSPASMHSTTIQIVIRVVDDNDNDPIFDRPAYSAVFPEDVMMGFSVLTLVATDLDKGLNANVTYTLSSAADGMFEVNAFTGLITTTGYFDREAVSSYSFDAYATDSCPYGPRSRSVRVDVTLTDVNDNVPVFTQSVYYVDMEIGLRVDPNVLTVSATDSDIGRNANITYALSNASTLFQIDPMTGTIRALFTFGVSEVGPHTLKVVARDAGIPSLNATCSVVIRVERVSPSTQLLRFVNDTYTATIPEHSSVGTTVLTVTARWNGSSPVSYSLANGDDIFYIDPNTGVISVANSAKLDYETSARLRLIVFATTATTSTSIAHDYTTVWINVVDINDNVPRFTQQRYQTSVWEGNLPDTYVTQVMATDADTNTVIIYDIVAGNTQSAFSIFSPNSGIVSAKLVLDREIQDSYRLEIRAYNPDTPDKYATAFLRIQVVDVNDNAPYFPSYNPVQVHESLPAGSMLLQVTANDIDLNPMLTYSLLSATSVFAIDKYSGKISTIRQLDYETDRGYSLNILVSDVLHNATRSVQIVVVDDNDNAPVFTQSQYQVSVDELTGPGVNVLTVTATDRDTGDNGRITYTMLQLDSFSIDHNTGVITTARQLVFNANQPAVHLVVTATDHGTPALSTTIAVEVQVVDINDHAPVFTLPAYSMSVSEDEVVGSTLLRLTATDADFTFDNTKLEFTMTSGNSDDCFTVIAGTGELLLVAPLDRERTASYTLTVSVADNGQPALSSTTQVYVAVQDVNDNSPVFNQSHYNVTVREDISVNSHIITLCAMDRDVTDVGHIVYSIVTGDGVDNFTIDSHSGVLTVKSTLDYETKTTYSLVVSAVDNGPTSRFTAFTEVNIEVTDINEYRPTFPVLFYYETITENQPNGTLVFTAQASDKDGGPFGVVRYQLSANFPTDLPLPFVIEADTGNVRSNAVFNYSVDAVVSFQFRVIATDAGGLNSSVSVLVVVQKEATSLQFAQTNYEFNVRNGARVGDAIGQVRVLLPPGSKTVVTYSLRPEDEHFGINRTTGIIYIIKDLNDWSDKNSIKRRRRRRSLEAVNLHVVATSGQVEGSVDVRVMVNRTAVVLPDTTLQPPGSTSPHSAGLSGVRLIIAIVLPCIAVVVIAVVLLVYFRRRKIKSPLNDRNGIGGHSTDYSSSLETLPPPPAFKGFRPPPYPEISGGGVYPRAGVHATTSEMTGEDDGVESSGRGSAEKGADDLDDEIRMINTVRGVPLSASQARRNNVNNTHRVPDSGIQPDHYDEDLGSETSDQRNNRACLQRLGVDVSGMGRSRRVGGAMGSGAPSVESMHQFSEEGGGEASGIELNDYKIGSGDNHKPVENSNRSSRRQSFDPIIDADLVLGTSYNWDYLLNWKPEYQPLAEVFAEIARLPDETANRRPPVKTIPTQIVPQRPANQRLVGGAPRGGHRDGPPPIITGAPPRSVRLERESSSSACSTTSSSRLQALSVPRSALTYESSFMMSPARTPSMSPAVTCSPSVSPVDRSSTHSRTPVASRPQPPGNRTVGRRCSEQEIQI